MIQIEKVWWFAFALVISSFNVSALFREVYRISTASAQSSNRLISGNGDVGEPLFLTPFISSGKIAEARNYSSVPTPLPNIVSNSGFFTVNEQFNSSLFFWFFQKNDERTWKSAPVILWLQGGPGSSSLFGLFTENGPFSVTKNGLKRRKYSWTNEYNVLFIDNPVGTGFSFTNNEKGYATNQEQVGLDLYSALLQFFKLYPELQKNKFYLTGESYAGKYIPAIAYTIHKYNPSSKLKINLKGLFIGNGWCDPLNMMDYGYYLHRIGLIDHKTERQFAAREENVRLLIRSQKWIEASMEIDSIIGSDKSLFFNATGFPLYYDYMHEKGGADPIYMEQYLQRSETRKHLHVGSLPFNNGDKTYEYLLSDIPQSIRPWIQTLLEYYPIMFYSGQLDIIVAYPLSVNFLRNVAWSGAFKYKQEAVRHKWYVDRHLVGYYKRANNLIDVLVRDAGHMVPTSQPKYALKLLTNFVEDKFKE